MRQTLTCYVVFLALLCGCHRAEAPAKTSAPEEVIVYTALDQEFSAPIFAEFTRATGIMVRAKYDAESTKTVGLAKTIIDERGRPRCDLFWNNEILNTL